MKEEEREKSLFEEQLDTIKTLLEDRNYWKSRCKAAEEVINAFMPFNGYADATDKELKLLKKWQQMKI